MKLKSDKYKSGEKALSKNGCGQPGICVKCGKETEVRYHHYKGYGCDDVALYCRSCDRKAHNKAIKEGRCTLTLYQRHRKSNSSSVRRCIKKYRRFITFQETLLPDIVLQEILAYNIHNGEVYYSSYFRTRAYKHILEVHI